MENRPFGRTGHAFPILSFGGGAIGNARRCDEAEALRAVNLALDRGIRYFDTLQELLSEPAIAYATIVRPGRTLRPRYRP